MKVEIISCLKDNYSYAIIDEKNKKTCVVDPSESKPIINFLEKNNLKLNYILNTHHHYDHVGGNSELKKKYKAKVVKITDYGCFCELEPGLTSLLHSSELSWNKKAVSAKKLFKIGDEIDCIITEIDKEKIAVIPSYTRNMCGACNRLRITADGKLMNCLYSQSETNLRDAMRNGFSDEGIESLIRESMMKKYKDGWEAQNQGNENRESMTQIGG